MNLEQRACGVLLHITSLPGPHGIGDFGPGAYHFVNWLVSAGQSVWQLLPTTPIGPCDSPYQSVSAFAGSPMMVALEPLVQSGWLTEGLKLGQIALAFGCDDMGGTLIEDKVLEPTGITVNTRQSDLVRLIRDAGFVPVQRDTNYNAVKVFGEVSDACAG